MATQVDGPVAFGVCADGKALEPPVFDATDPAVRDWPMSKAFLARKMKENEPHLGVKGDFDADRLDSVGWAVLFAPGVSQAIKDALAPLLDLRRNQVAGRTRQDAAGEAAAAQAGVNRLFKIFDGESGRYEKGLRAEDWLTRHDVNHAAVVPSKGVPYYVLIVGSPVDVSLEFQYELDLFWAVGRLWFDDPDPAAQAQLFRQYAESVVKHETGGSGRSRQLAVFAPVNAGDPSTNLLADILISPLVNGTPDYPPVGSAEGVTVRPFLGDTAVKPALDAIFRGTIDGGPPALLFTGSHGYGARQYPADVRDAVDAFCREPGLSQAAAGRGALICGEWMKGQAPSEHHYYAGADLPADANVHGLIHVMFACYGVGWPEMDSYARTDIAALAEQLPEAPSKALAKLPAKVRIAPAATLAQLPQKLLSHPKGGALAVLGHIDQAWAFDRPRFRSQHYDDFYDILSGLLKGARIGHAIDSFNFNWASRSAGLHATNEQFVTNDLPLTDADVKDLRDRWLARDDARNYLILGDPAVRLWPRDAAART